MPTVLLLLVHKQHHDLVSTLFSITGDTVLYVCDSLRSEFKLSYGDSREGDADGSVTFETALPCSGFNFPDIHSTSVGMFATSIESM